MDSGDFWKLVVGGAITLIGAWLLEQVRLGGRRRRRRRELKEELELLEKLEQHPEVAARLRRRVEVGLEAYEPSPETRRARRKAWISRVSAPSGNAVTIPLLILSDVGLDQPLVIFGYAVIGAFVGIVVEEVLTRRLLEREEQAAVDELSASDQVTTTDEVTIELRKGDGPEPA